MTVKCCKMVIFPCPTTWWLEQLSQIKMSKWRHCQHIYKCRFVFRILLRVVGSATRVSSVGPCSNYQYVCPIVAEPERVGGGGGVAAGVRMVVDDVLSVITHRVAPFDYWLFRARPSRARCRVQSCPASSRRASAQRVHSLDGTRTHLAGFRTTPPNLADL